MTEYEKWLADEKVPYETRSFMRGYSVIGCTLEELLSSSKSEKFIPKRDQAIERFSFAIPNDEAVEAIKSQGPILEIGAGTGYWAYELRKAGADVTAVDPCPYSDNAHKGKSHSWGKVFAMDAQTAIRKYRKQRRTLLTVWPSYDVKWPVEALLTYLVEGGSTLVYVGEGAGGCTADDEFHDIIEQKFTQILDLEIPQWAGIHDRLMIYKKA